MPPCDDCLQRARRHGSYGDVCQSMNDPLTPLEECGFQMQPLNTQSPSNAQPPPLPGLPPLDLDLNFPANNSSRMHNHPSVTEGYCCKHGISTGTSVSGGSLNHNNPNNSGTPSLMIVSRRESFDEKEEVEAVESSV